MTKDEIIKKRYPFYNSAMDEKDIEIDFTWDYGYGGRGSETMRLPVQLLKDLIKELEES